MTIKIYFDPEDGNPQREREAGTFAQALEALAGLMNEAVRNAKAAAGEEETFPF